MIVEIRDRDHALFAVPAVQFVPLVWRFHVYGGPRFAAVRATGDERSLYNLLSWLGYELRIVNEHGTLVWWGCIYKASLDYDGRTEGYSLDTMYNRIAVVYSTDAGSGVTDWAEDPDSIAVFSAKEWLPSYSGVDASTAEQIRDTALAETKYPAKEYQLGREGQPVAVLLECRGWYDTLAWTHYSRDEGLVEHVPTSSASQKVGWGFTSANVGFTARDRKVAQLFSRLNTLEKGEKVAVTGSVANNTTLTIEETGERERATYTADTIAFSPLERTVEERIRASHDKPRALDNFNLFAQRTSLTTLFGASPQDATTIQIHSLTGLEAGYRVRIALNPSGHHETFVDGNPDTTLSRIDITEPLPLEAVNGATLERVNRWVTNEAGDVFYEEGTDYTFDATNGTITVLSSGSITNNQVLKVHYRYTEYRIEDTDLGLGFIAPGDIIQVSGASEGANNSYFRVLSAGAEGEKVTVREAVTDEGPGASVTIARGESATVEEALADELPGSTVTVTGYGVQVAQSFVVDSDEAWTINQVEVRVRKVGSPSDSLRLTLRATGAGHPGTIFETVDIPASSISTQMAWVTAQFANTTEPVLGSSYWIGVGRSGAADSINYYEIAVDEDLGAASSVFEVYDGSSWVSRPTNADMLYRILGSEETTEQIRTIVDEQGQFLAGADILDASGISTLQYRDGRTSALYELEDLLDIGTTSGRRLLATVTQDRILRVEEEPAEPGTPPYVWHSKRKITDHLGRDVAPGSGEMVGKWMGVANDLGSAGGAWWARQGKFLVEGVEYVPESEEWDVTPRGSNNPWEVGLPNA